MECLDAKSREVLGCRADLYHRLLHRLERGGDADRQEEHPACDITEIEIFWTILDMDSINGTDQEEEPKAVTRVWSRNSERFCPECISACETVEYDTGIGENEIDPAYKNDLYYDSEVVSHIFNF